MTKEEKRPPGELRAEIVLIVATGLFNCLAYGYAVHGKVDYTLGRFCLYWFYGSLGAWWLFMIGNLLLTTALGGSSERVALGSNSYVRSISVVVLVILNFCGLLFYLISIKK